MQMEAGNPTSYIPTVGSPVIRTADQISIDLADIPSLGSEYTIYADFEVKDTPTAAGTILALTDGTADESVAINYSSAAALSAVVTDGGVEQANITAAVDATGSIRRQISLAVKGNDLALSADGGAVVADTGATLPTVDRLTLGALFGTTGFGTEVLKVRRLAIVPRRVPDADLPNWRYSIDGGPFDLILIYGQSNAVGRGTPLDTSLDVGGPAVFQWTRDGSLARIAPGNDPLDHIDQNGSVGPGVSFGHWYANNVLDVDRRVLLVPVAKGGASFYKNDLNPGDPYYVDAVTISNAAMASHPGNRIVATMMQHGETDADTDDSVAAYAAAQEAWAAAWRLDITGAADAPILVGGMQPTWVAGETRRQTVQAILADSPNRITICAFADSSGLTGDATLGEIHFSAASQRILGGERYAAAWQSLL
jgi:hypothetical protein